MSLRLPSTLSPSKMSSFKHCPLQFRFSNIDKLPEPQSPEAARGSLVHRALELLMLHPPKERTLGRAVDDLCMAHREVYGPLEADDTEGASRIAEATDLIGAYFKLEDPSTVHPIGLELMVSAQVGSRTFRGIIDRLDLTPDGELVVVDYKGLALDTRLPTPSGWTTMQDVQVGDEVFGGNGLPTKVIAKSAVHHRPCYRIQFSDRSEIICDNEHLWNVQVTMGRQSPKTMDTESMYHLLSELQARPHPQRLAVINTNPMELPVVDLPLDPWLLGVWLGNGANRGGSITFHSHDLEWATDRIARLPWSYSVSRPSLKAPTVYVRGLVASLRKMELLYNKHVPERYLRASRQQRLALLQGLMDTDGHWNPLRNRAVFVTTTPALAAAVTELAVSFGVTVQSFTKPYENPKRPPAVAHMIEFRPVGFNPFSSPRKATAAENGMRNRSTARATRRFIRKISPVPMVPTQCISVDSPDFLYLCGNSMIPTHNTGQAPREQYEQDRMAGVLFYALLCEKLLGRRPAKVRLIFLGSCEVLSATPTEQALRAMERKGLALFNAIERACDREDFRPHRSKLCDWCCWQEFCPAWGGDPALAAGLVAAN